MLARVLAVVSLLALASAGFSRDTVHLDARWAVLPTLVTGETVSVPLAGGVKVEGRVQSVEPDGLVLEVGKTSNKALYPKGRATIPRAAITELHITRYVGEWRRRGKMLGGAIGLASGLVAMAVIGLDETSQSSKTAQGAKAVGAFAGLFGGGLVGGWLLGRAADREITVIIVTGD